MEQEILRQNFRYIIQEANNRMENFILLKSLHNKAIMRF